MNKTMRLNSITNIIENGLVFLPEKAAWLAEYLHELMTFPNGKYDDQADSTSQALDWIKDRRSEPYAWLRLIARRDMIEEGRLDEVREMDERYGAPSEEPKPLSPSGRAVHTPDPIPPSASGPVVYTPCQDVEICDCPPKRSFRRR